jgi:hypothetical protein
MELKKSKSKGKDYSDALLLNKLADISNVNNDSKKWKVKNIIRYLNISSTDRNMILYPNINNFSITLKEPIKNVHSIFISKCSIPKGEYTIDNNNYVLRIKKGAVEYTKEFNKEEYDIVAFVDAFNVLFNVGTIDIQASFNSLTSKINFTCPDVTTVLFYFNDYFSPYFELGFPKETISWNTQYTLTSHYRVDLFGTQEIEIQMNELPMDDNVLDVIVLKDKYLNVIENDNLIYKQIEPYKQINSVSLRFINKRYNELYNFNGLNLSLYIGFVCYKYSSPQLLPELSTSR